MSKKSEITVAERQILDFIKFRSNERHRFFGSNEYIGNSIGLQTTSVKNMVNKLVRLEYLTRIMEGKKRYLQYTGKKYEPIVGDLSNYDKAYLQVKDCYTDQLKPKDVINLDYDKNKGKHACSYFMNSQMKKEFADYLQQKWGEDLSPETYLFTSQKRNRPYNRVSISRLFGFIYNKFGIKGASHLGRHLFVSKLVNAGVNICLVQKLANHRNIVTTQRYFIYSEKMLANAVENVRV